MLSCKDTSTLISRSMDETLSWRQRLAVRLHLMMCGACRRFVGQMSFLRRAAGRYPGAANRPDGDSR